MVTPLFSPFYGTHYAEGRGGPSPWIPFPWKYWLITQEAMAPSRLDWKIVDWDVKPQHNTTNLNTLQTTLVHGMIISVFFLQPYSNLFHAGLR